MTIRCHEGLYVLYPGTPPGLAAVDVPASMLAFASGRGVVAGPVSRSERDELAGLVEQAEGGGTLAGLLRGDRPLRVQSHGSAAWVFEFE